MMATEQDITGPVNLGNPDEYKVKKLAKTVINLTGSKSGIVYRDLPQDDPVRRKPDIRKARKSLGWYPQVDLETGLSTTIEYFKTKV